MGKNSARLLAIALVSLNVGALAQEPTIADFEGRLSAGVAAAMASSGDTGLVGLNLEYARQYDNTLLSVYADVWGEVTAATPESIDWMATFRGRFGHDFDGFIPYVNGGIAVGHASGFETGPVVGIGVEARIDNTTSVKVEGSTVYFGADQVKTLLSIQLSWRFGSAGSERCPGDPCPPEVSWVERNW